MFLRGLLLVSILEIFLVCAQTRLSAKIYNYQQYRFDFYPEERLRINPAMNDVNSMRQCEIRCNNDGGCRSFFYNPYSNICIMSIADPTLLNETNFADDTLKAQNFAPGWIFRSLPFGQTKGCSSTDDFWSTCTGIDVVLDVGTRAFTLSWFYPGDAASGHADGSFLPMTHQVFEIRDRNNQQQFLEILEADARSYDFTAAYDSLTPGEDFFSKLYPAYNSDDTFIQIPFLSTIPVAPLAPTAFTYSATDHGIDVSWDNTAFAGQAIARVQISVSPHVIGVTCSGTCDQLFDPDNPGSVSLSGLELGTVYTVSMVVIGTNGLKSEMGQSSVSSPVSIGPSAPELFSFEVTSKKRETPEQVEITLKMNATYLMDFIQITLEDVWTGEQFVLNQTDTDTFATTTTFVFEFQDLISGRFYQPTVRTKRSSTEYSPISVDEIIATYPVVPKVQIFADTTSEITLFWDYNPSDPSQPSQLIRIWVNESTECSVRGSCEYPRSTLKATVTGLIEGARHIIRFNCISQYSVNGTVIVEWGSREQLTFYNSDILSVSYLDGKCSGTTAIISMTGAADYVVYAMGDEAKPVGDSVTDLSAVELVTGQVHLSKADLIGTERFWFRALSSSYDYYGLFKSFEISVTGQSSYTNTVTLCITSGGEITATEGTLTFRANGVDCARGLAEIRKSQDAEECSQLSCDTCMFTEHDPHAQFEIISTDTNASKKWDITAIKFTLGSYEYSKTGTWQIKQTTGIPWTSLSTI